MKGYEDEYNLRKQNLRKQKELEDEEDRKRLVDVGALERAEKARELEKKRNLLQDQLNDLDDFNKKKALANQQRKNEDEYLLRNAGNAPWGKQYDKLKDNLKAKSNRIFDNELKYNNA